MLTHIRNKNVNSSILNIMESNNIKLAAIEYNESTQIDPVITIQADGIEAETVLNIARKYGIPIVEDSDLASELSILDEGETLPRELFLAVAVLFNKISKAID